MMTRITLVLKFLGLSAFWGLVLGAGIGFVGGTVLGLPSLSLSIILYLIILFAPISALYGTFIGGIGGAALGVLTALFYYQPDKLKSHKWLTLIVLPGTTFLSLFLPFALQIDYTDATAAMSLIYVLVIAVIGSGSAVYASQRIARWYLWWHEYNYIRPISIY